MPPALLDSSVVVHSEKLSCKYCGKSFRKLSTLSVHRCEPKRRWEQEKEVGVQFGLRTYLRFFEMTQGSAKTKTYTDFAESPYYSAFVKFGQHIVKLRAVNPHAYIEWTLKNVKKVDYWTKDQYYDQYLYEYLRREHPNDALERTFTELQRWADETGKQFTEIFTANVKNKVCLMLVNGRISPWIIYNCESGVDLLSSLNEEQITMIFKWIDPEYWQQKFKDFMADTELTKSILKEAGM